MRWTNFFLMTLLAVSPAIAKDISQRQSQRTIEVCFVLANGSMGGLIEGASVSKLSDLTIGRKGHGCEALRRSHV
jgi:hypothetical protein